MDYFSIQESNCITERNFANSGYLVGILAGNSMYPFLKERDVAIVRPSKEKDLKKGDIILYSQGGKRIFHRIVGIRYPYYLVAGDHCITVEEIQEKQIIGKMEFILRDEEKRYQNNWYWKLYIFLWGIRPNIRRWIAACLQTINITKFSN